MSLLDTVKMQKIRVVALQSDKYEVVRMLHSEKVIDVRKSKSELADDSALDTLPRISELLVKFKSAESILREFVKKKKEARQAKHLDISRLVNECEKMKVLGQVFSLSDRERELGEDNAGICDAIGVAKLFVGTGIGFSMLKIKRLKFTALTADRKIASGIKDALSKKKIPHEIIEKDVGKGARLLFLAYDANFATQMNDALRDFKIREIDLSNKFLFGKEERLLGELGAMKDKNSKEIASIKEKLSHIAASEFVKITTLREMLEIEAERASISLYFKKTKSSFCVEGWIPKQKVGDLEVKIRKVTKNRYMLEEIRPEEHELAPTLTNRPKWLRSFDYMMEFMSVPRSDEIDPTWIFIITFPIFYGLMVSDAGYGLASLIFAYLLTRITEEDSLLYHTAKLWEIAAVSAIFFGVISNQYFGFSLNYAAYGLGSLKLFDWFSNVTTVLLVAIFFGISQVILGLAFGFFNKMRHHETKLAISKITSIIAILTGIVAVGGGLFNAFNPTLTLASAIVAVVTVIATGALSGIEATETLNLITHPLSYARLLGFGMASVIIASLVDKWFTPSLASSPLVFVGTLIVFILLHFFNMILSIFEGIVQSARLNFVEFFSKFFSGGGVKFQPFSYKRVYTKEE